MIKKSVPVAAALLGLAVLIRFSACNCSPGAAAGSPCETAADCAGDLVCDPATHTCADLRCTGHADCGRGAYCSGDHCVDNRVGGPCQVDLNCVAGETCINGTCGPIAGPGGSCDSAEDCTAPLICNPQTDTCVDSLACTTHADCGPAAHCTADGVCERSVTESPCDDDTQCLASDQCIGVVCVPDECEGQAFSADRVPANVMIVLDRSSSMTQNIGSDGSKWNVAKAAIAQMLAAHGSEIRFGLNLFPGTNQSCEGAPTCQPSPNNNPADYGFVPVDIGDNTASTIDNYLANTGTCNARTPAAEDLQLLRSYDGLKDTTRGNYILLVTDGQANCNDPVPQVEALYAQVPSVHTFVVGFGSGVDRSQLTAMAIAGGTARPQTPNYYQADDAASLNDAFAAIAGAVLGCEYSLVGVATDPDQLTIYFNGVRVPRDPSGVTGWEYYPATGRLTFSGNACIALQHGVVTDLTIVYGCPLEQPAKPDGGTPRDAGPGTDASGSRCNDRCIHPCGNWACLLPEGVCGPCEGDGDCCPNSVCLIDEGICLVVGG
ncbi:MAG: VWA domain-containing protein [Deltaproteobacteria bacterium]|nr:VWA domain-containing protein [Deltaproteobacteria bacterium]